MSKKIPHYPTPLQNPETEEDCDYFELTAIHQIALQNKLLAKFGKTPLFASELAKSMHEHADTFFEDVGNHFETDCKAGCSYCCYQPATLFVVEAIRIADILKESLSKERLNLLIGEMKTRVQNLKGNSVAQNINDKTRCPLLLNEQCSIYNDRPLTCRKAHSFSVKRCRAGFQKDRFKTQIPVSLEIMTGLSGIIEAVFEELPKHNLDGNLYELCSGILVALEDPDAASKWVKNDPNLFKNAIRDDT